MKREHYLWAVVLLLLLPAANAITNTIFTDLDGDGDLDTYLEVLVESVNGQYLLLNGSDGIGNIANVTQGYFVNVDGDGDEDLYIVRNGFQNFLYRNDGSKTFTNISATSLGVNITGTSASPAGTAFADFDSDGDIDAFVAQQLFISNGSFANVNGTNRSNVDELPPLRHVAPLDVNLDNLTDIVGVTTNGSITVFLNLNDTNGDFVPEFYDATQDIQFQNLSSVNFAATGNFLVGFASNRSLGFYPFANQATPFVIDSFPDFYLARAGANQLYVQSYPETVPRFTVGNNSAFYLPRFEDRTTTTISDTGNSTVAIIADFDNNNFTDILIGNSVNTHNIYLRNGSSWLTAFVNASVNLASIANMKLAQAADLDNDNDLELAGIDESFVFDLTVTPGSTAAETTGSTPVLVYPTPLLVDMFASVLKLFTTIPHMLFTNGIFITSLVDSGVSIGVPADLGHITAAAGALSATPVALSDTLPVPPLIPGASGGSGSRQPSCIYGINNCCYEEGFWQNIDAGILQRDDAFCIEHGYGQCSPQNICIIEELPPRIERPTSLFTPHIKVEASKDGQHVKYWITYGWEGKLPHQRAQFTSYSFELKGKEVLTGVLPTQPNTASYTNTIPIEVVPLDLASKEDVLYVTLAGDLPKTYTIPLDPKGAGSCDPYQYFAHEGTRVWLPDPCCVEPLTVPSLCCQNRQFVQGKKLAQEGASCHAIDQEALCLPDIAQCDVGVQGYIQSTDYGFMGGVDLQHSCDVPVDILTQSMQSSQADDARNACQSVSICVDGEKRTEGSTIGSCSQTQYICRNGNWRVVAEGVQPTSEICDGVDNDCDGLIDEEICLGCVVGERKACVSEPFDLLFSQYATCEQRPWGTEFLGCEEIHDQATDLLRMFAYGGEGTLFNYLGQEYGRVAQAFEDMTLAEPEIDMVTCTGDDLPVCVVRGNRATEPVHVVAKLRTPPNRITGNVVAEGFEQLASYDVQNCEAGTLEIAVNVPPVSEVTAEFNKQLVPTGLTTQPDVMGVDVQLLQDIETEPQVSFAEVREGVVLSEKERTLSAQGVVLNFEGAVDGMRATLSAADIELKNKGLAVLGLPLKLTLENYRPGTATLRTPLLLNKLMDPNSLGLYVFEGGEWVYKDGKLEGDDFVANLDLAPEITFMIAGSTCRGCKQAYLHTIRDVNSKVLTVLVHGFYSDPRKSMSALIKQFDDEDINVDVAVFGYAGNTPTEAAQSLAESLHRREHLYDRIVFISHSLGGLIVREMLEIEQEKPKSLVPKVEALLMAGTPNLGTPAARSANNLFTLFGKLLGKDGNEPMSGVHPETLQLMEAGLPYDLPSNVKAFTLVGTRDYFNIGQLLGIPAPQDAMVPSYSVNKIGTQELGDVCVNTVAQATDHFALNKAKPQRYTLLYFLRELSSAFNERAPTQLYAVVRVDNCAPGTINIYGKPTDPNIRPLPRGCEAAVCGDGICQIREQCEQDCDARNTCTYIPPVTLILLLLSLILLALYHHHYRSTALKHSAYQTALRISVGVLVLLHIYSALVCVSAPLLTLVPTVLLLVYLIIDWLKN